MNEGVEALLRAWFANQEGYFGTCKGVEDVSTGAVTHEGDPLFDGAVDVRNLAMVVTGWFAPAQGIPTDRRRRETGSVHG